MRQVAYALAGVLLGFVLAGALFIVMQRPGGKPVTLEPSPTKAPIEVHVVGDVVRPGLYELPEGSRVKDAIDAAGGLIAEADPGTMNLAAKLEDGQQLQVGSGAGIDSSSQATGPGAGPGTSPFTVLPTTPPTSPATDLIDINNAAIEDLDQLPGISPTVAQNIVNYRNENGPFSTIEDIMNVPGVGPATFDAIKDFITTGD
jgi:competence protein ComEA